MKFDRLINKLLLERLQKYSKFGISSYVKDPEQALKTLDIAYKFLKDYNLNDYNYKISPQKNTNQNAPIIDAIQAITVIIIDSNLDTYRVDGANMDRNTLIKNVIKLASRFGQTEFGTTAEQDEEKARTKRALGKIDSKKSFNNERYPYPVDGGNYPDMDGNPIPDGELLSGTDYRLYIFAKSGIQVRLHGGIDKIQECYKELFPIIGIRYQPYGKGDKAAKNLEDFGNLQYETLYWWGENSLPYRSLITVSDGFVRSVPVPGQTQPKVGLIQFTSDKVAGRKKARPFSQIGDNVLVGAPHGDVIEGVRNGDPIDQVKAKMESMDFDPIRKEKKEVDELWQAAKNGNAEAKQRFKDALERHKEYQKLVEEGNSQEIIKIYENRIKHYWKVYNDPEKYPNNQKRPPLNQETSIQDAWPFFHIFKKVNGKYGKPLPCDAKTKYEFLYPKELKEIEKKFYKDIVTQ